MPTRRIAKHKQRALPSRLRSFFWDYKFKSLSWKQDHDLVIARILAAGDWNAVIWLRTQVEDSDLAEWITRRRGAGLSPRQLRFWELILELPHRQVSAWLLDPERLVWDCRAQA